MYDFELTAIVNRAAKRLKESNGSRDAFYRITQQEARSSGVSNPDDLKKITNRVRTKLTERSAASRSSKAASKRISAGIAKRLGRDD